MDLIYAEGVNGEALFKYAVIPFPGLSGTQAAHHLLVLMGT